ncbi:MAG: OB-fold domain-containing protein [Pseudomonadota bacterium]
MNVTNEAPLQGSPLSMYRSFLQKGQLAYQYDEVEGKPVFFPRVLAPGSGNTRLTWRVSAGKGSVYSVTTVSTKNESAYNIVLIDMDEGYRLMSRVESVPADQVRIGLRVKVRIHEPGDGEPPYPIFDPE